MIPYPHAYSPLMVERYIECILKIEETSTLSWSINELKALQEGIRQSRYSRGNKLKALKLQDRIRRLIIRRKRKLNRAMGDWKHVQI